MSARNPARFVFASSDHPKRIAKLLNKQYSQFALAACQETLAHMCGHATWHEMSNGAARGEPPSAFDEDATPQEVQERFSLQLQVLKSEFASTPSGAPPKPRLASEEAPMFEDPMTLYRRREWEVAPHYDHEKARAAVLEILPTARTRPEPAPFIVSENPSPVFHVENLGAGLSSWFRKHVKHQPEVAQCLADVAPDPRLASSLLQYLAYWGELCHHYANSVSLPVQMYGLMTCAMRLAVVDSWGNPEVANVMAMPDGTAQEKKSRANAYDEWEHRTVLRYLRTQLRTDMAVVWERQPSSMWSNAETGGWQVAKLLGKQMGP